MNAQALCDEMSSKAGFADGDAVPAYRRTG